MPRNTVSTARAFVLSSIIAAGVALAAPAFALNLQQYRAGHVPASGSADEARTCSAASALFWLSARAEPGYANPTPDDKEYYDRVENQMLYWLNTGSQRENISGDAYMEAIKPFLGPVSEMGREVNFAHYERCLNIWYNNVGGNIGGGQ